MGVLILKIFIFFSYAIYEFFLVYNAMHVMFYYPLMQQRDAIVNGKRIRKQYGVLSNLEK